MDTVAEGRQPSVSVAMATYNGERFVRPQLDSLSRQSRLPAELVVMDDASTDATVSIVEEFARGAPFPVRVTVNPARLGWRENFFKAMAACRGDLIALCDQDDVWHDEKLQRCAGWFERRHDLALLVHAGRVVNDDLTPTGRRWPPIRKTEVIEPDGAPMWFEHHGMSIVFPRWVLSALDATSRPHSLLRREAILMNHDSWICFAAPSAGSTLLLADELVLYRRHEDTVSSLDNPLGGTQGWRGLFAAEEKADGYRALAARCLEAADYLDALAERRETLGSGQVGFRVARRVELHRRAAEVLVRRAEAVDPRSKRKTRFAKFMGLLAAGGYGRRDVGGLGPTRAPLDLVVAVALPAAE